MEQLSKQLTSFGAGRTTNFLAMDRWLFAGSGVKALTSSVSGKNQKKSHQSFIRETDGFKKARDGKL